MTKFRPCIDLHNGSVKQIVGSTLVDESAASPATKPSSPVENFVADQPAEWFAKKYRDDGLTGGHLIKIGAGNDEAARSALTAYPSGLQIGGGINLENASTWLDAGASHVILTSWLFEGPHFQFDRLESLVSKIGHDRIVIDLSCKRTADGWTVAKDRWQTLTDLRVTAETLDQLATRCDEFLIHAADVEGKCDGIDVELVQLMGRWGKLPMTYAGGVKDMSDVKLVADVSDGKVDVTVGSALDLFGGTGVKYDDLLHLNRQA